MYATTTHPFRIPPVRTKFHSDSFFARNGTFWNRLPRGCFPFTIVYRSIDIFTTYPRNRPNLHRPLTFMQRLHSVILRIEWTIKKKKTNLALNKISKRYNHQLPITDDILASQSSAIFLQIIFEVRVLASWSIRWWQGENRISFFLRIISF